MANRIKFGDIDKSKVKELSFEYLSDRVVIKAIQTEKSDKTTHQYGLAWLANGRLIGKCNWQGLRNDKIDGRTSFAKSYTFIIDATLLIKDIKADPSGFEITESVLDFYDIAKSTITDYLSSFSTEQRKETTQRLRDNNRSTLCEAGLLGNSRWNAFIKRVQESCPKIKDEELDDFTVLLDEWHLSSAKAVLDEVKSRLTLVEAIRSKINEKDTLEVQELQPLFKKGLWIFGPEFESIEYSSNDGMTSVIRNLFKLEQTGSRNRHDFVVLKDSTVSLDVFLSTMKNVQKSDLRRL